MADQDKDQSEKGFFDRFFDAADAVVGTVERTVSPSGEDGLWTVEEIEDDFGTSYRVTDGKHFLETKEEKLAKRVCDALNG